MRVLGDVADTVGWHGRCATVAQGAERVIVELAVEINNAVGQLAAVRPVGIAGQGAVSQAARVRAVATVADERTIIQPACICAVEVVDHYAVV